MKYALTTGIILGVLIAHSCDRKSSNNEVREDCKVVLKIGGCNQYYCGVKFTDGTFSDRAERPVEGVEMCDNNNGYFKQRR